MVDHIMNLISDIEYVRIRNIISLYFWVLKTELLLRLCLVTVFVFYVQKLVFGNINK